MATGKRSDPYAGCRFHVEIDGLIIAGFTEVAGLGMETEVKELREGGVNEYIHKLPGAFKHPNLVLKRGITDSDVMWNWCRKAAAGSIERKNGCIILLDSQGNEKWRWNFHQAFPVKWNGPQLQANASAVAVEMIELAHRGLEKG